MENNQSTFIGKGKQKENGKVMLSIKMKDAEGCVNEYKGERYLRIHVVKMKKADQYGNTHTAYSFPPTEESPVAQA